MRYPDWKAIALVFGTLILLVLCNFFWQAHKITKTFKEHSLEHSRILATVVQLNIENTFVSLKGLESVIASYLENSSRFIRFLNRLEPFSGQELEAFAGESGLEGIKIINTKTGQSVEGPEGWIPKTAASPLKSGLIRLEESRLYIYTLPEAENPRSGPGDYIMVGLSSGPADQIQQQISVDTLLGLLNKMKGIEYVKLHKNPKISKTASPVNPLVKESASLIRIGGSPVSETRIKMEEMELVVGLEADYFSVRIRTLRKEMFVFMVFLIVFGAFSSWWLNRIQQRHLELTRKIERELAKQREHAALGRATTTIAHEIRNPLNAISMGLQRLQLEADVIPEQHKQLVASMRDAVNRSNKTISSLQQYTHPLKFNSSGFKAADLIESIMTLYRPQFEKYNIVTELELDENIMLTGDETLLSQAFENLTKNALEAQPDGGFLRVQMSRTSQECGIRFENHCALIDPETVCEAARVEETIEQSKLPVVIAGSGKKMQEVLSLVYRIAPTDWPALIRGETGTGKELIAKLIHLLSTRKDGPFIEVNCAAIPENLFESELFGHEKGAFTGASNRRIGRFELADKGTIFLDEIGELPLQLQAKLLRSLQERKVSRVGSEKDINIDIRVLAATNRDLKHMVDNDRFREDLYFRLNVLEVEIPPLRERREDIPELIRHFFDKYAIKKMSFHHDALDQLVKYDFPGNVRELEHLIQRLTTLARTNLIHTADLPPAIRENTDHKGMLSERLAEVERKMILSALQSHDWVQTQAAASLGISERVLRYKMKKMGIKGRQ